MREQYLQVIISHGLIQAALWKSIAYSYRQYWYAPAMVIRAHSIWHDNVDEAHYNHSGHSLTCQSALGGADVAEIHVSTIDEPTSCTQSWGGVGVIGTRNTGNGDKGYERQTNLVENQPEIWPHFSPLITDLANNPYLTTFPERYVGGSQLYLFTISFATVWLN